MAADPGGHRGQQEPRLSEGLLLGTMGEIHRASPPDAVERAGRRFKPAPDTDVAAPKASELDLGDAVADPTDTDVIERLVIEVVPASPDFIAPQAIGGRT